MHDYAYDSYHDKLISTDLKSKVLLPYMNHSANLSKGRLK